MTFCSRLLREAIHLNKSLTIKLKKCSLLLDPYEINVSESRICSMMIPTQLRADMRLELEVCTDSYASARLGPDTREDAPHNTFLPPY
jgi:hypothetical protein